MTSTQTWKAEAQAAAAGGETDAARNILEAAIAAYPDNPEPRTMLCQLHLNDKRYGPALAALEPALETLNSAEAYLLASQLMVQENRARDAIDTCAKGIALAPASAPLLVHLAQIYMALNQSAALDKLNTHARQHLSGDGLQAYEDALKIGIARNTGNA